MTKSRLASILLMTLSLVFITGIILLAVLLLLPLLAPRSQPPPPGSTVPPTQPFHSSTSLAGKFYYAGMPRTTASYPHHILVLTNIGYVVGYDEDRKDPVWTCFRLFKVNNLKPPKRTGNFKTDNRTQSRVSSSVYAHSGYDMGHNAPDKAISLCYGAEAVSETYLLSNVLPETPGLNRHAWMLLEKKEIEQYAQRFEETWTITGPIFDAKPKTLSGGVQIPRALYRIIVDEENGKPRALAFIIPQNVESTASAGAYLTSVREIERETGLDFMSELPDDEESRVEGVTNGMW